MSNANSRLVSWLILLLLACIWGSSFILMWLGMFDLEENPLFSWDEVAALRISLAGLALLPVFLRSIKKISKKDWQWIAVVGLCGNGIPAFLFTGAETQVDTGVAGILNGMTPIFVMLLGVLFFALKVRWQQVLGIGIGFLGAAGLVLSDQQLLDVNLKYSSLIVIATMCYGLSVNVIHSKLSHLNSVKVAAGALAMAGLPCALYLPFTDFSTTLSGTPGAEMGLVYVAILGVIGTALALILFNRLIQRTSGLFATTVTYLIPLVALLWGLYFGEEIGWRHALFGGVILSGVYLVNKKRR